MVLLKKLFCLTLIALLLASSAFAEEAAPPAETDDTAMLMEAHEERVLNAFQCFCRYLTDEISVYGTGNFFERNSDAWNLMTEYDGGWFSPVNSKSFENLRTENWEKVSETEFCVDVYGDYTMRVKAANEFITYSCGWHFCFHQTDERKNEWHVYDFSILENKADYERAEKFTLENEGISLTPVLGKTFTGYMMVIEDPSRVFVGCIEKFGVKTGGVMIDELVNQYDALGGINGGGFSEASGGSSKPSGIVLTMGDMRQKHSYGNQLTGIVMGFDQNDRLVVGSFTRDEIDEMNLRDALGFGPALIINGEIVDTGDERDELSIRTAIGQDAEGRVLMLITRGRQPDSLGANMADLQKILTEYGAVNAGNLDGGNSSCMYLNNESVYSGFRLETSRTLPAGFLIKKLPEPATATEPEAVTVGEAQ